MGKRRPAAKPTSLRILHGDRKDRINANEPVAPASEITAPDWLSEKTRQIWDRLVPSLTARKVLTSWDVDAFAVLCEVLARYATATQLVNGSAL